jgi:hypothetical protein
MQLTGATKSVNRQLEAKARAVAGLKGYLTNLDTCPDGTPITAEFVIGAYHRLIEVEKSFRMSKHDLQATDPQARLDRSPPDHRVHRPGRQPLHRTNHRLVDPQVRTHRPPLPHHPDPGRRPHRHAIAGAAAQLPGPRWPQTDLRRGLPPPA